MNFKVLIKNKSKIKFLDNYDKSSNNKSYCNNENDQLINNQKLFNLNLKSIYNETYVHRQASFLVLL